MAVVEVIISVRLEPDAPVLALGISNDAETIVDRCFYSRASTADDALAAATKA